MLTSTSINIQHIHKPTHTQLNLVLALQHTQTPQAMTVATQRKICLENEKKKWDVTEFREWLCFVLRYTMNSPYQNLQNVIMSSKNGDKIFDDLSRKILTKTSKECSKFSRKMIKEMKSRTDQGLLKWSVNKLKKQAQNPQIAELISEFEAFSQKKSAYMQILAKMDQFYDSQEL